MSLENDLRNRSNSTCELCTSEDNLTIYPVLPQSTGTTNDNIIICENCHTQLNDESKIEVNHWRCLNDSMWSEVPAVQVVAYRMLHQLRAQGWTQDLLDMMYLDEDNLAWAHEGIEDDSEDAVIHKDVNGVKLAAGDNVVFIKDLNVKGAGFTAKRGTAVRGIHLDPDNENHIEGRVNGQQIVILTQYVKKS